MLKIEKVNIQDIKPYKNNAKRHTKKQISQIKKSIQDFGFNDPVAIDENNIIIEGHGRYEALKQLGYSEVECIRLDNLTEEQIKAFRLADNKVAEKAEWDFELLTDELSDIIAFDMSDFGFDLDFGKEDEVFVEKGSLEKKFGAPPFSVINANQGYWKKRKTKWKELWINYNKGRETNIHTQNFTKGYKGFENQKETTSLFDPVLCEIVYKWFNVKNGKIIDPFAGGCVRGVIAEKIRV